MSGPSLDVVVLAGGEGRRLGRDKALLDVDGRRLVDRVLARVAPLAASLVVAVGPDRDLAPYGVAATSVADDGSGPVAGLRAALPSLTAPLVAVVAVDQPWVSADVIRGCASCLDDDDEDLLDAAVPVVDGRRQVLHAVLRRDAVADLVASGETSITRWLDDRPVVELGPDRWPTGLADGRFAHDLDEPADLPPGVG